ncbi:hypothetical protein H8356DRAFT_1295278 [Neocallimastix lanati (nom. inval.)]|nr:hypothetical protein H8356DRAFT_1295278 [Neocallimastix sp. JGI-2020a]
MKHKIKDGIEKSSIPYEDNIEIEISETNRGNEQIIINKKHKFNFSFQRKDKSKIYRCTEYKTLNKCKSLIILNDKKKVLKYESLHNHLEKKLMSPKFSYQLFITRTYVGEFNMFYTTSISILKNKKQSTYETLFKEIKKNANKFRSNTLITTINFHCDFEQGISNAAKKVFPNINIKYCVWHYKRSLEKQKNILCYHEVKNNNDHLTNNASESYNSYLNNIFPNKPLFYKLIYILKEEEKLSYNDYQRRTKGNWKKKQKIFSATDEIKILIENYKSKEINLFYNGYNRNELIKLRKECLIDLNDININLK